jgi:hypothetical protein
MVKGTLLITGVGLLLSLMFVIHVCCVRELWSAILSHVSLPNFPALFSPVHHACLHLCCVLRHAEKNVVTLPEDDFISMLTIKYGFISHKDNYLQVVLSYYLGYSFLALE